MSNNHLNPHDHFFRSMMANQKVAREFFATHLPYELKQIIDVASVQLQHNSYISDSLREQISDLLFKANFSGTMGYIYILVEHQSQPERLMPFRILKYMTAIMEDHLKGKKGNTLPIIYPIIFYTGKKSYQYSTDLFDLFEKRELAWEIFSKPYLLIDISKVDDNKLDELLWYGSCARIMKYIHEYRKNIIPLLRKMMGKLRVIENLGDLGYIRTTVSYFVEAGEVPNEEEFREVIKEGLTKGGEDIMSYAEVLTNRGIELGFCRGRETGKVEGKAEGKAEAVLIVAMKLLRRNLDPHIIADITGLPLSRILELKTKHH